MKGTIVTLNDKKEIVDNGFIGIDNSIISFICKYEHEFPSNFRNTIIIDTKGYIYPGLIDLHNHLSFNFLDLWNGIERTFKERYEWKRLKKYQQEIVAPAKLLANSNPRDLIKYSEVKALVSGTTSVGGLVYFNKKYSGWLLRNLEKKQEFNGQTVPILFQNVIPLTKIKDFIDADKIMRRGISYIYHLAEGTSENLLKEFYDLHSHNLVREKLIGVHCTALNSKALKVMGTNKAKLIWSPLSNLLLYGKTTDIISAKKNNVLICLGSDWSPTGSKIYYGN